MIVNAILLFAGMLTDGMAGVILIKTVLLPIVMNEYVISPYRFGVAMCLNLVLGLLTPPAGVGINIVSSISRVSPGRILKSLWPFLLAVAVILVLLSRFPWLSTVLI